MSEAEIKKANKRKNERFPNCQFRFESKELKRRMNASAKRNHRTLAGEINLACEKHLEREERDERKAVKAMGGVR